MSKTLTPRELKRLSRRLETQMEMERNGAPIPGEVLERMTPLKADELLYQLWVEIPGRMEPVAIGPRMSYDGLEPLLAAINGQIALGKEKRWGNPHILPCVLIN